ncbi:MAG: dienelactone hydrolase family protein [Myxococcota bacterium]
MKGLRPILVVVVAMCVLGCTRRNAKPEPAAPAAPEENDVTRTDDSPDKSIQTEEVSYTAGDTTLKGYVAWDANQKGPRPGVLVVHEWWGHGDYVRKRARMLAELGYTALALDMYGDGKQADHPDDAMKFMTEVVSNMGVAKARFDAAYELLKGHGTTNPSAIAAIGYCFGGAVALHMARFGADLAGVVSFHGNLATEAPAKKGAVKSKVLVLHGADDELVPAEQVSAFKTEMDAAEVDYDFVEYPGAKHAFTNPAANGKNEQYGIPLGYDEAADQQSWQRMVEFLEAVFPPS